MEVNIIRKVNLSMDEQKKYEVIKSLTDHSNPNKQRAALTLGCTVRHINRMIKGYRELGKEYFIHGNRGRKPANTIPDSTRSLVVDLYRNKYYDANFEHFTELLALHEDIHISPSSIMAILESEYILSPKVTKAKKKRFKEQLKAEKKAAKSQKEADRIQTNLDSKDISAYLQDAGDSERKSQMLLERFAKLEQYILNHIPDESLRISYKQLNENAVNDGINTSKEKDIRTLLYFLTVKGYTRKKEDAARNMEISRQADMESTIRRFEKRLEISRFAVEWLYKLAFDAEKKNVSDKAIQFSIVELLNRIKSSSQSLFGGLDDIQLEDVEEALLYLSKIGALKLEGGFLVLYNAMNIQRIKDNKSRYKQDDYRMLNEFYKLKIQQVHIVGEYANLMVRDYHAALQYVQDYFQMDYKKFVTKYFKGDRTSEIQRN